MQIMLLTSRSGIEKTIFYFPVQSSISHARYVIYIQVLFNKLSFVHDRVIGKRNIKQQTNWNLKIRANDSVRHLDFTEGWVAFKVRSDVISCADVIIRIIDNDIYSILRSACSNSVLHTLVAPHSMPTIRRKKNKALLISKNSLFKKYQN